MCQSLNQQFWSDRVTRFKYIHPAAYNFSDNLNVFKVGTRDCVFTNIKKRYSIDVKMCEAEIKGKRKRF